MKKLIRYKILGYRSEWNPITKEIEEKECLADFETPYSEVNEEIAKRNSYNGEYEIYDDGQPDPAEVPTQLDIIEAQVTYTALMTDTLLVTEDTEAEEDSTGDTEIESDNSVEDNVETPIEETEKEQLDEVEDTPVEPENQEAFVEETTLVGEVETDVSEN